MDSFYFLIGMFVIHSSSNANVVKIDNALDIDSVECSRYKDTVLIHISNNTGANIPPTQIQALQNQGIGAIENCTVTQANGKNYYYNITGCSKDKSIDVYIKEHEDGLIGGKDSKHFKLECRDISPTGTVIKVSMGPEHVTDKPTTKSSVGAKLNVAMVVTYSGGTSPSSSLDTFVIGEEYKLWITGPSDDYLFPQNCIASSTKEGADKYFLVTNSCAQDTTVLGDFKPQNNDTKGNLCAPLYGFRFINSKDVYLSCSIKVCPTPHCGGEDNLKVHIGDNGKCGNLTTTTTEKGKRRSIKKLGLLENDSRPRRNLEEIETEGENKPTVHEVKMKLHVVDTPTKISGSRKLHDIHSAMLLLVSLLFLLARNYF